MKYLLLVVILSSSFAFANAETVDCGQAKKEEKRLWRELEKTKAYRRMCDASGSSTKSLTFTTHKKSETVDCVAEDAKRKAWVNAHNKKKLCKIMSIKKGIIEIQAN